MSTDDVVIEVDLEYTWNVNTYTEAVKKAGNSTSGTPKTLEDILKPGNLMVIQGNDANGEPYSSCNVIAPDEQDEDVFGINAQWDYNILSSDLPEASKTKKGSMLFLVSSSAENLKLYMLTPTSGQAIGSGSSKLESGAAAQFSLDLT